MRISGKGRRLFSNFRKNSIFKTFCIFCVCTIVLTSILSGILIYYFTTQHTIDSKAEDMKAASEDIHILYSQMYTSQINNQDKSGKWISAEGKAEHQKYYYALLDRLELYNNLLGIDSFITNSDGSIFMSYPLLPDKLGIDETAGREYMITDIISKLILQDGKYYFKESDQFYTNSADDYIINTGDFYGLYSSSEHKYLTITRSIAYNYPGSKDTINKGSITLSIPMPEITKTRSSIIGFYIAVTFATVLIEVFVLIYITRRITEPIRKLERMTKQISKGNFDVKIENNYENEIGHLIDSYNSMLDDLRNLDTMRNDFIASISHELRTPMTSISGFIDGILDGVIPPESQEHYLIIVKEEITRMNGLVNDLLNMARLQSGKVELDILPYNAEKLIYNTALKLEPLVTEKSIELSFDVNTPDCDVMIDKASIERVFINLIQNAIKFTPKGGKITIHSEFIEDNKVQITIEDTGSGISAEELPFIFEKFYKVDKSRGLDKKGTGLGLALVKGILKSHNQTIRAESTVGEGSRFIFTLDISRKKDSKNE